MEKTDGGKEARGTAEDLGGEMKSGESELEGGRGNGGQISAFPVRGGKCLRQIGVIASTHAVKQTAQLSRSAKLPGDAQHPNAPPTRNQGHASGETKWMSSGEIPSMKERCIFKSSVPPVPS